MTSTVDQVGTACCSVGHWDHVYSCNKLGPQQEKSCKARLDHFDRQHLGGCMTYDLVAAAQAKLQETNTCCLQDSRHTWSCGKLTRNSPDPKPGIRALPRTCCLAHLLSEFPSCQNAQVSCKPYSVHNGQHCCCQHLVRLLTQCSPGQHVLNESQIEVADAQATCRTATAPEPSLNACPLAPVTACKNRQHIYVACSICSCTPAQTSTSVSWPAAATLPEGSGMSRSCRHSRVLLYEPVPLATLPA